MRFVIYCIINEYGMVSQQRQHTFNVRVDAASNLSINRRCVTSWGNCWSSSASTPFMLLSKSDHNAEHTAVNNRKHLVACLHVLIMPPLTQRRQLESLRAGRQLAFLLRRRKWTNGWIDVFEEANQCWNHANRETKTVYCAQVSVEEETLG